MKKNRRRTLKSYLIDVAIVIAIVAFCWLQNNYIVVSEYTFESAKVPETFDGYKIVQLSDLHNKSFGKDNSRLIEKIKKIVPDIIVITGDIVDSNHGSMDVPLELAGRLTDICPVYYVTGNHEYWLSDSDFQRLMHGLEDAGVEILNNESLLIKRGEDSFRLIGLDDRSLQNNTVGDLKGEEDLQIVLAHEPHALYHCAMNDIDLLFAGHEHGGQFYLPFLGGIISSEHTFFPEYYRGMYVKENTTMIMSGGLGNSVVPIRLFNYPDIVVTILHK